MRDESEFVAPVVKAVLYAIKSIGEDVVFKENTGFVVVGAQGFVGKKILRTLEDMGFRVSGVDLETDNKDLVIKKADVIISATGTKDVVKKEMVKQGAFLIDVGSPHPEFEKEAIKKAVFVTPVPGGIGPLTIEYLIENLIIAAKEQNKLHN